MFAALTFRRSWHISEYALVVLIIPGFQGAPWTLPWATGGRAPIPRFFGCFWGFHFEALARVPCFPTILAGKQGTRAKSLKWNPQKMQKSAEWGLVPGVAHGNVHGQP